MKKTLTIFAACLLLAGSLAVSALAANRVPEISVEVALREDGSAYVTQEWRANTDEGTEFYLYYQDSGYLTISDFSVSDENGTYELLDNWDVDASFEEKAGKCGIVQREDGVELCWGITDYGEHRYAIEYVLHDLVGAYTDADGFNHRFINADMGFFPSDVVLTIRNQNGTPITDDKCDIWAFGYEGQIQFENGAIRAWTEAPLEGGANMTVMVRLEKGILSPNRSVDESFEAVKERAFEGSDYGNENELTGREILTFFAAVFGIIAFIAVAALIAAAIKKAKLKKLMNETDYFRDAPNGGDLNVTYRLGETIDLCEDGSILGARLLRLIVQGSLEPLADRVDDKDVSLQLVKAPNQSGDRFDEELYAILEGAAGEDGILQPRELEKFCEKKCELLRSFLDSCTVDGNSTLVQNSCYKRGSYTRIKDLSVKGRAQLAEILGLKRFLLDFSLIRERYVGETIIWQDYMVYAMLLGIADKVAVQMKELYPQDVPQIERYEQNIYWAYSYNGFMYGAMRREERAREAAQAARSAGSGGGASFGGGGGFSGGGGGGSR
ncbi:MAG: DUF2207 domain-containing protein [Oscillospiraceae bacterium]